MRAPAFHIRAFGSGLGLITAIVHFVGCYTPPTSAGEGGGDGGANGSTSSTGSGGSAGLSVGCPAGITTSNTVQQKLPQETVDTTFVRPPGTVHSVESSANLQSAIDAAAPGDVIELLAGVTFTGTFKLPKKLGNDWIVIRTSTPDANLPPEGTRISPADAPKLAKLVVSNSPGPVLSFDPGAHHYRLLGLEIAPATEVFVESLIDIGSSVSAIGDVPHHIVIDRSYLHGDATVGTRRAIALGGAHVGIVDSYLADLKNSSDSQAILGWNGLGPYKIVNNYLEAASQNILFGGAGSLPNNIPSDIEICRNHFYKPLIWKNALPVKTHFEVSNAQRILFAGNVLENNWRDSQNGFAVILAPYGAGGAVPGVVHDVTFTLNHIVHSANAISLSGNDNSTPTSDSERIVITNNLFEDINRDTFGGNLDGRIFQIITAQTAVAGLEISHNTAPLAGNGFLVMGEASPIATNFVFRDNLLARGDYGAFGTNKQEGTVALEFFAPNADFTSNAFFGGETFPGYPGSNHFFANAAAVGFVNYAGGDFALGPSSPLLKAATDGKAVGADIAALEAALVGVVK